MAIAGYVLERVALPRPLGPSGFCVSGTAEDRCPRGGGWGDETGFGFSLVGEDGNRGCDECWMANAVAINGTYLCESSLEEGVGTRHECPRVTGRGRKPWREGRSSSEMPGSCRPCSRRSFQTRNESCITLTALCLSRPGDDATTGGGQGSPGARSWPSSSSPAVGRVVDPDMRPGGVRGAGPLGAFPATEGGVATTRRGLGLRKSPATSDPVDELEVQASQRR